jgi:hypothetical protein
MLMHSDGADRTRNQLVDARDTEKLTIGGSNERELNDWQVNPTGSPSARAVMTVMPLMKWPKTCRMAAGDTTAVPFTCSHIG